MQKKTIDEDNSLRIEDDFAFDWNSIREEAISQLSPRSEEEMIMRDREEQERRAREDRERDRENEKRARVREREREREKRERERKEVEREREKRELKARQVRRFNSGDQPAAKPFDIEPSSTAAAAVDNKTPRGTSNADKRPLSRSADRRPTVERVKRSEHRRGKSAEDAMAISEAEMKLLADSMLEKRQRQIEEHTRNASRSAENKSGGGGFGSGGLAMTSPPGARRHSKQLLSGGESEMEKSRDKLMFEQAMAIMRLEEAARSASKKPSGKGGRDREKEKARKSPAASASASPTQTSAKQLRSGGSIPTSTSTSTTGASGKKGELNSGDLSVGAEAKESRDKSSSSKSFDDFAEQKRKEEQRKERQQQDSKRSPGDEKNEGEAEGDKNEAEEKKKKKKTKKEKAKKKEKTKRIKGEAVDEEAHCSALFDWDSIKEEAMIALPRDGGKAVDGDGDGDDKTSSSVAHRTGTLRYMPAGIMPRPSLSSSVSFPSPSTSPSGAPPTFAFGPASSPDGPPKKRPTLLELLDVDADADANETGVDSKTKAKAKTTVPTMKRSTTSPGGLTRGDVTQPTRENGNQRRKENEKETKREKDQATEERISPRAAPTRRRKAAHHHSLERSSPAKNGRNAKLVDSDDDDDDADGNGDAMIRRHKILRERTKKVINDSRDVDNSGGPVSRQPYSIGTYLSPGPDVDGRRARRLRMANATPIRRRPPTPGQAMAGISGNAREQPTMVEAFVLSYKSIFAPRDLCQALVKRYTTAPPRPADANKIQEGVVSVFEQWINLQVMDFYEDNEVLRLFKASPFKKEHREGLLMLLEQKRKQLRQERFQALAASTSIAAQPVRQSLERPLYRAPGHSASQIYTPRGEPTGAAWDRNGDRGGRGPTTYRPDPRRASRDVGGGFDPNHWMSLSQSLSLSFSSKNLNNKSPWVRIKSSEMAQQMALVEHRLLRAVPNKEWLNVNWTRKAKELLAPNILALSCHFNVMSNWVTYEVLSEPRNDARAKLIQKFARIAVKCRQLNNFNGLLEILAGLGNVAVTRLTKTWKDVDPETRRVLKQLDELMSPTHNRRNYRRLEAEAVPPCVPYLGVSLGDLFFIEANEMEISGLVNFEKLEMIGKVIYTLLLFQNVSYQFEPDEGLQAFLASPPQVPDEDSLYSLSLSLQPLEGA